MNGSPSSRDIVTRPAASVASSPPDAPGGRLRAVVVGAMSQTQPADALRLALLTDPAREAAAGRPTREGILEAVRRVAASAGEQDTVFVYFAGHGGILDGRTCLFPCDVRISQEEAGVSLANVLAVDQLQEVFKACPCGRRVMFLDCCQNAFSAGDVAEKWSLPESGALGRAVPWRTGMPLTTNLLDAFQQSAPGWSLVLACGPNEVSLEDPEWGSHGIFSHFLATGLRGEADLDGDGTVALPELVQYLAARVPKQAEAIIEELRQGGGPAPAQRRQNPTMIWSGPISLPLTRRLDERRAGYRAVVLLLWLHLLTRRLPYPMAVEGMVRYGTAALYGLAMALTVWLFAFRAGWESWIVPVASVGVISGLLWLASFALAGAANAVRWHNGGYVAALLTTVWHPAVFVLCVGLPVHAQPELALQLGVGLLVILSLMIIFGHNALHGIIALADLVKRDLKVAGRRAFVQLERRWIHADIDNTIPMVSGHPLLYQVIGLITSVLVIVHAGYWLLTTSIPEGAALQLARDFVLLVLIQWQAQWFTASYRKLRGILMPER
jgi:hypothetical protein